ncbi:hypothetical protein QWA68_001638 [Fusarium oxysporum]|nr:hypothetical protein QWA68_001638 [Fusarium oxysporum]
MISQDLAPIPQSKANKVTVIQSKGSPILEAATGSHSTPVYGNRVLHNRWIKKSLLPFAHSCDKAQDNNHAAGVSKLPPIDW